MRRNLGTGWIVSACIVAAGMALGTAGCGSDDATAETAGAGGIAGQGGAAAGVGGRSGQGGAAQGGAGQGGAGQGGAAQGGAGQGGAGQGGAAQGGAAQGGAGQGGGGGQGNIDLPKLCADACTHTAQANCSADPSTKSCTDSCVDTRSNILGCDSESSAHLACVAGGTVTCNSSNRSIVTGCDTEHHAYVSCGLCATAKDDDACKTCVKSHCCQQRRDLFFDGDFWKWTSCLLACTPGDTSCEGQCKTKFPTAAAKQQTLDQCKQARCSGACP